MGYPFLPSTFTTTRCINIKIKSTLGQQGQRLEYRTCLVYCIGKPLASNCLLFKWTVTAFRHCKTVELYNNKHQTRVTDPLLNQCWSSVYDAVSTLIQQWVNISCLLCSVLCHFRRSRGHLCSHQYQILCCLAWSALYSPAFSTKIASLDRVGRGVPEREAKK